MQHVESAEQIRQPRGDRLFEQDEILSLGMPQVDESRQDLGQLHHGKKLLGPQPAMALEHRSQVELAVVEMRRGMAGVDGHRSEDGERPLVKKPVQLFALRPAELIVTEQSDPLALQLGEYRFVPAVVLPGHQFLGPPGDLLQLRDGPQPVGRVVLRGAVAEGLLAQAGHADHEELVQVRAEDREELDPLEQRVGRVLRFFEHPLVEFQPGQFAVDEMFGQKAVFNHAGVFLYRPGRWPYRATGRAESWTAAVSRHGPFESYLKSLP